MDYLSVAGDAVQIACKVGAYQAEAYVLDAKSLTIEINDQKMETFKFANDVGIGIRIISKEGRVGFAYSTDINAGELKNLALKALNNSRKSFMDKYNSLPEYIPVSSQMALVDKKIGSVSVEEKIELAKQIEIAARRYDQRIQRTEHCAYEDAEFGTALANSNGLNIYYRSGYCGLYGIFLAENDSDIQTGMALNYVRDFDKLDPVAVGEEAAKDAVLLLGAKRIRTTKATLVLSPYIVTNFFSILIPALCADAVQKGRSLFQHKLGKKVAASLISLIDDGKMSGGIATGPVDGEGVPTGETNLIVDGVLHTFLHNHYTAAKDNVRSTGNGVRNSFKGMPEVGPTNIYIKPGDVTRDTLISQVQNGFYVTNVMGMHTANPISGDFSVGAAGVWIKDGEMTHAVRGVAIAGNILDFLGDVDGVANDLRFFGAQGAPTIRISGITISGA